MDSVYITMLRALRRDNIVPGCPLEREGDSRCVFCNDQGVGNVYYSWLDGLSFEKTEQMRDE